MLRLNLESQNARLAIRSTPAKLDFTSEAATTEIRTQPAKLGIQSPAGVLEIDSSPFRASLGIKNFSDFSRDFAKEGLAALEEHIGKVSAEGTQLSRIENSSKGSVIKDIAKQASSPELSELTLTCTEPITIQYQSSETEFSVEDARTDIEFNAGRVDYQSRAGDVNISVEQQASLRMWTTGQQFDHKA